MNSKIEIAPSQWVEKFGDALFRYASMRISDPETAQDLVQDTFIAGIQSLENFKGQSNLKTWLTAILKHKILDHYRKQNREIPESHIQVEGELGETSILDHFFKANGAWKKGPENWESNAESILIEKEKGKLIYRCLEGLSAKYRQAFLLKEVDEVDSEEICQTLGITSSNLWVLLHRSRLQLRKCIENLLKKEAP